MPRAPARWPMTEADLWENVGVVDEPVRLTVYADVLLHSTESRIETDVTTPEPLPHVTDYVRISPPWASIQVGRTPLIKWHDSRGGARRSAQNGVWSTPEGGTTDMDEHGHYPRWDRECTASHGVARVDPNGDLIVVESWYAGQIRD